MSSSASGLPHALPWRGAPMAGPSPQAGVPMTVSHRLLLQQFHQGQMLDGSALNATEPPRGSQTHTHTHKAEHPRPPPVSRVPGDVQDGPHRTGLYFMPCGLLQFADLGHKIGSAHALRGSLPQGMPPLPWMTPHWLVMMLCPSAPSQTQRGQTLSACHTMGLVHGVSQSTVLPFRDPPGSHA